MEIIIDIPDKVFKELTKYDEPVPSGNHLYDSVLLSIYNGTLLPEGHGDLIDKQALITDGIEKGFCNWYDEIKYADVIIKADKESK